MYVLVTKSGSGYKDYTETDKECVSKVWSERVLKLSRNRVRAPALCKVNSTEGALKKRMPLSDCWKENLKHDSEKK